MAYVITEPCVATCHTACVDACPCDSIHGPVPLDELRSVPQEERAKKFGEIQLFIDPETCIDCGACLPECPVAAIHPGNQVPEKWRWYAELNAKLAQRHAG